jgi:hypothetical protein
LIGDFDEEKGLKSAGPHWRLFQDESFKNAHFQGSGKLAGVGKGVCGVRLLYADSGRLAACPPDPRGGSAGKIITESAEGRSVDDIAGRAFGLLGFGPGSFSRRIDHKHNPGKSAARLNKSGREHRTATTEKARSRSCPLFG